MKLKNITPIRKFYNLIFTFVFITCFHTASNAVTNTALVSGAWENGLNWSLFHAPLATEDVVVPIAMTVNANDVCLSLTVIITGSVSITGAFTLSIAGNFANAGTFTAAPGSTLVFNAAVNSTVTGSGTFTVKNITLNMGSKTTLLDIQSTNFITGINTGNVFNFTFTQGTWKQNNAGTLTDCHNVGTVGALTIPFPVVIQADAGTINLCKFGTASNVLLSGKLFVNGGAMTALIGQAIGGAIDFKYKVNGGTPQLYITSGSLDCGAGFNPNAGTDYIDFNMTGGLLHVADNGPTVGNTFVLQNVVGGSTVFTGGIIAIEDACISASPDVDFGGPNVTPFTVTGGYLELGYVGSLAGATFFGLQYYTGTNYPNIIYNGGIAKSIGI